MIQTKQQYQAYTAATQTVARTKQIVMLYDGVIRFLQQARIAIEQKRIEDRYNLLIKASSIVYGLQACLDFEKGGNIAKVLYNFYADVGARVFSIHRTQSLQTCDDVIADVKKMRDVWHDIDQGSAEPAPDSANAPATAMTDAAKPASSNGDDNITLSA